jgi:hypothetical protein
MPNLDLYSLPKETVASRSMVPYPYRQSNRKIFEIVQSGSKQSRNALKHLLTLRCAHTRRQYPVRIVKLLFFPGSGSNAGGSQDQAGDAGGHHQEGSQVGSTICNSLHMYLAPDRQ